MILSGDDIYERYLNGEISIKPFDKKKLNPNSYNLTLAPELVQYDRGILDMKIYNHNHKIVIPEEGYMLVPGTLYLARTNEWTQTRGNLVPMLEGRSSIGRLGLFIHVTAGFGDNGFAGYWTLELHCVQPIIIYPGIDICQMYFHEMRGENKYFAKPYNGKYQNNNSIQASQLYREFYEKEE